MQDLLNISFLQKNDKITSFVKGWSGDKTYLIEREDKKYFLKIIKKHMCDFDNFKLYEQCEITTPKLLEYGKLNNGSFYYIAEYIKGNDFGDVLYKYSKEFVFTKAKELGSKQHALSKLKPKTFSTKQDESVLFLHYDEIISDFFSNLEKYKEQIDKKFLNVALYEQVIADIEKYKQSFNGEYLYYSHDDFMPNNFMIDCNDNIYTIDYEGSKYSFFAKKLRGYIQHMFHKKDREYFQCFFNGFINGYFSGKFPPKLAEQMAYIYLVDLIDISNDELKLGNIKGFENRVQMLYDSYNRNTEIVNQCKDLIF